MRGHAVLENDGADDDGYCGAEVADEAEGCCCGGYVAFLGVVSTLFEQIMPCQNSNNKHYVPEQVTAEQSKGTGNWAQHRHLPRSGR